MKLTCPACGACGAIEFFLMDASAREAVRAAFGLPAPLGRQVMSYIGLFRPMQRALTWDRVEKLLAELLEPIQAAQVTRNGIVRPAPVEYWKEALDQVLTNRAKLNLPLKSHGYLFEIVANMSGKAAGAQEQQQERARQRGDGRTSGGAAVPAVDMAKQAANYQRGVEAARAALKKTGGDA